MSGSSFCQVGRGGKFTGNPVGHAQEKRSGTISPLRHVPAKIIAVSRYPYTINMKKVELAVRNVVHGKPSLNKTLWPIRSFGLYKDLTGAPGLKF